MKQNKNPQLKIHSDEPQQNENKEMQHKIPQLKVQTSIRSGEICVLDDYCGKWVCCWFFRRNLIFLRRFSLGHPYIVLPGKIWEANKKTDKQFILLNQFWGLLLSNGPPISTLDNILRRLRPVAAEDFLMGVNEGTQPAYLKSLFISQASLAVNSLGVDLRQLGLGLRHFQAGMA